MALLNDVPEHLQEGRFDEAAEAALAAASTLERLGGWESGRVALLDVAASSLYRAGRPQEAAEVMASTALPPMVGGSGGWSWLAVQCLEARRYGEARTWAQRAVERGEEEGDTPAALGVACHHLGMALLELDEDDEALVRLDAAIAHFDAAADWELVTVWLVSAHRLRARCLRELERFAESEEAARHALALDPADGAVAMVLGSVLMRQERWREAAAHFEELAGRPEWALSGMWAARSHSELESWTEAVRWGRIAAATAVDANSTVLSGRLLARALRGAGEPAEALELLEHIAEAAREALDAPQLARDPLDPDELRSDHRGFFRAFVGPVAVGTPNPVDPVEPLEIALERAHCLAGLGEGADGVYEEVVAACRGALLAGRTEDRVAEIEAEARAACAE